jgi:hypothetical protein
MTTADRVGARNAIAFVAESSTSSVNAESA